MRNVGIMQISSRKNQNPGSQESPTVAYSHLGVVKDKDAADPVEVKYAPKPFAASRSLAGEVQVQDSDCDFEHDSRAGRYGHFESTNT